jgi:hypothetical protein
MLSTAATSSHENNANAINLYMNLLDTYPLVTKSISSGIISAVGDVLAQCIEAKTAHIPLTLNWIRLTSFWLVGTIYVGPFLHFWYAQLWKIGKWLQHNYNAGKKMQTLVQVLVDQILGVAMFFPAYFYAYEFTEAFISWRGMMPLYCESYNMM